MTTKRYSPECMDRHFVALGKEGEGNHLALRFDTAVWREAYPEAEILLWVTPPVGEGYFAELAEQSGDVIWTVTQADTAHEGNGEIELILRDVQTGTTLKSATARTIIKCSPSAREAAGDPPAPHVPWWQRVMDALVGVVRSVNGVKPGPDGNIVISGVGSEGSVGAPGEDGGFYTPSVSRDGVLSWEASKAGMPDVPDANIKGPDGEPGKDANITTENIAKALGYTPAKQEDVRSLSEHKANRGGWTADKFLGTDASGNMVTKDAPPGGYTLPIASTDTLGGVKVGNGLRMDGDVLSVASGGENAIVEDLFYVKLEEPVTEIIAKLTRRANHMFVLVYRPDEYEDAFYVYVYATDLQTMETIVSSETQITDGVRLEAGAAEPNYVNRFLCKLDFQGGLLSAYWGISPEEYQTKEWSFLNRPIKCTYPDGINKIILRNYIGDKLFPKGTAVRIVGA